MASFEFGLLLKKLDKKLERTLLHSYRKDLTSLVDNETDPVALLPKVVSLLHLQVHNKIIQAPGRAISAAIFRLKDKLEESAYNVLMDYHAKTVSHLSLLSAANGDAILGNCKPRGIVRIGEEERKSVTSKEEEKVKLWRRPEWPQVRNGNRHVSSVISKLNSTPSLAQTSAIASTSL
ncbi:hypothetical protein AMTR_s00034p00206540 [Amborella trichopoda]|uniref:E3 UFM1-protein ligase-like C-terminal domain-containing protein n=1 Tax=Amborella trichopoda TaxID=13333 RepID=W1PWR3_AMBTC|nr:hypothetical protein AMTR_s00034p00206540 [Amborella trichopoda]